MLFLALRRFRIEPHFAADAADAAAATAADDDEDTRRTKEVHLCLLPLSLSRLCGRIVVVVVVCGRHPGEMSPLRHSTAID